MNYKTILLLLSVTLIMGLFQLPSLQVWVRWDHDAIIAGQWWRIVTGNLTHTNLYHLAMNGLGLWIISYLFRDQIKARTLALLLAGLCFSIGTLLLLTSLQIYVGLSGALHGMFGFYALKEYFAGRKSSLVLVVGLITKIAWEQSFGSATGSEALIGAAVAINAHLFGAASGLIAALVVQCQHQKKRSSSRTQ